MRATFGRAHLAHTREGAMLRKDQKEGLRGKASADGNFFAVRHYTFDGFGCQD